MTHVFLQSEAKKRLKTAVEAVEEVSAAEIMVVIRPWSGRYWHASLLGGAATGLIMLLVALYSPWHFSELAVVLNVVLGFVLGAALVHVVTPLKLLLAGSGAISERVQTNAQAHFYRLGVDRTRDRSGILLFVSLMEGRAELVPDVGITTALGQDDWKTLAVGSTGVLRAKGMGMPGLEALAASIEAMAEPLADAMPVREDDINELPDIVEDA